MDPLLTKSFILGLGKWLLPTVNIFFSTDLRYPTIERIKFQEELRQIKVLAPEPFFTEFKKAETNEQWEQIIGTLLPEGIWLSFEEGNENRYFFFPLSALPKEMDLPKTGLISIRLRPWKAVGFEQKILQAKNSEGRSFVTVESLLSSYELLKKFESTEKKLCEKTLRSP